MTEQKINPFFRSTGALNRGHGKQKISFSRKFPFMKSRERLNKLDDDESFENGSNHRYQNMTVIGQKNKRKIFNFCYFLTYFFNVSTVDPDTVFIFL
jgi:hypothetical protein